MKEQTDMNQDQTETAGAMEHVQDDQSKPVPTWKVVTISAVAAAVVGAATAVGVAMAGLGQPKIATVDLAGLVEIEQMRMTSVVMNPDATEDDKMRAFTRMKGLGELLETSIADAAAKCNCVVLARNAVISNATVDLTQEVKVAMGIGDIDLDAARSAAQETMDKRIPDIEEITRRAERGAGK